MARTSYIQRNYDIRFVLWQHGKYDLYSASSLKQQSTGKHIGTLGNIILIQDNYSLLLLH